MDIEEFGSVVSEFYQNKKSVFGFSYQSQDSETVKVEFFCLVDPKVQVLDTVEFVVSLDMTPSELRKMLKTHFETVANRENKKVVIISIHDPDTVNKMLTMLEQMFMVVKILYPGYKDRVRSMLLPALQFRDESIRNRATELMKFL